MKCPYCGKDEDRVLDTRIQKEGEIIKRRRECLPCKGRFSTIETLMVQFPFIIKKDGRREPYSREKLLRGIQAACQKRPISLAQMETIVEVVTQWVLGRIEKEISAQAVGQRVMQELRRLDNVAYVRFASVYRTFKDVQEFLETLEDDSSVNKETPHAPQIS
jgi:transcriptional repressor NrdR